MSQLSTWQLAMENLTISNVDAFCNPRKNNAVLNSSQSATKCNANAMGL